MDYMAHSTRLHKSMKNMVVILGIYNIINNGRCEQNKQKRLSKPSKD